MTVCPEIRTNGLTMEQSADDGLYYDSVQQMYYTKGKFLRQLNFLNLLRLCSIMLIIWIFNIDNFYTEV